MNKILIFLWYLITEPFVQIRNMFWVFSEKGEKLNYPRTWRIIFFALMVGFFLAGNKLVGNIFLALVIITVLKSELDSGKYMERWREKMKKKAEKEFGSGGQNE